MDKEQIRIAVAEELGWAKYFIHGNGLDCDMWFHPSSGMCYHDLPKYPDSLDACVEFESTLDTAKLQNRYQFEIADICWGDEERGDNQVVFNQLTARPIQRCIAFLKTRNNTNYLK